MLALALVSVWALALVPALVLLLVLVPVSVLVQRRIRGLAQRVPVFAPAPALFQPEVLVLELVPAQVPVLASGLGSERILVLVPVLELELVPALIQDPVLASVSVLVWVPVLVPEPELALVPVSVLVSVLASWVPVSLAPMVLVLESPPAQLPAWALERLSVLDKIRTFFRENPDADF